MHRQTVLDPKYVGEGNWGWTPERTSSAYYITRAAPGAPHPRPKSSYSDAYGFGCWGPTAEMCSWKERGHGIEVQPFLPSTVTAYLRISYLTLLCKV